MSLQLHYTGQDYINRGLAGGTLTPGSTSAIVGGCKTGKGFVFDGTVDSVLSSQLDKERIIHSFSVWFRITDINNIRFIVAFGERNYLQFMLWQRTNGQFMFGYCDNEGTQLNIILNSNLPRGIWYHFGATINGLEIKLYLNGSLITTLTAKSIRKGSNKILKIGGGTTANYMLGQICNFKYYDHVLSQKEINDDYRSLILHYKLDKPITTEVLDHSGFNRHITNLTTNAVTLDSKAQVYSASLKNDGTQGLMGDCDLTDLNGIPEISISFRVYKQNIEIGAILTNRTVQGNGIAIFILRAQIYVDLSTRNQHSYTIPLNEWVNICVTQSATEQKLYANGVLVSTMTSSTLSGIGNYTSISNSNVSGRLINNRLNGNVQDIRFYATALTEDDVKDLYNTRHSIDKNGNYYTYELIEGQTGVGMKKNGITNCDELIENEDGSFSIKSDKTIKVNNIKEI